ncbi:MAG: pyrimidine dimer DNA glycosylase/endonuclease V [Moraxella sp.]|nr:pyrimidine dimer DNA glycosylase/endonuclease V [Moraxella sp.]
MNIFYLDNDPVQCAAYHCDKHVVKMILETAQLLCSAHHLCGTADGVSLDSLYRLTHQNHPCAIWVRASYLHYDWTYRLFIALCQEYTHRYARTHLTDTKLTAILAHNPITPISPITIDTTPFVPPPAVMPDEYKNTDVITAYRTYYKHGKADILTYTHRDVPVWLMN